MNKTKTRQGTTRQDTTRHYTIQDRHKHKDRQGVDGPTCRIASWIEPEKRIETGGLKSSSIGSKIEPEEGGQGKVKTALYRVVLCCVALSCVVRVVMYCILLCCAVLSGLVMSWHVSLPLPLPVSVSLCLPSPSSFSLSVILCTLSIFFYACQDHDKDKARKGK